MVRFRHPASRLVIQGDIHINCRLDLKFEQSRLEALADRYINFIKDYDKPSILILAGDVFDYDTPSYDEIKVFYEFIKRVSSVFKSVYIINGNHDSSIFTYLPEANFRYIHTEAQVVVGATVYHLVSWSYLPAAMETMTRSDRVLVSHARCTLGEYIKEEVDIKKLSDSYRQVILGDIHDQYQPYPNVYYTSSPSAVTFKKEKATHGFITIYKRTIKYVPLYIPTKHVVEFTDVKEAIKFINSLSSRKDYYKVKVRCLPSEAITLRSVTHPRVKKEVIFQEAEDSKTDSYRKSLDSIKDFLSAKADVTEYLFEYMGEKSKYSRNEIIELQNLFKESTKGKK